MYLYHYYDKSIGPFKNLSDLSQEEANQVLQVGFTMEMDNEDEEEEANFYYCEHQPTYENKVEVLEVDGDCLLLHLVAKTEDVNFYDGSKPKNELDVTAWFVKQED